MLDSASHSRSLPRQVTPDMLWVPEPNQQSLRSPQDNLSRVARWVEAVSTRNPPDSPSTHEAKHAIEEPSKSSEIPSRGSSAPAARYHALHGPLVFRSIKEAQQTAQNPSSSDPRKPDGASDPGINQDGSFGSGGLKPSSMKKPAMLQRFADLFVCSPGLGRQHRQQQNKQLTKVPQTTRDGDFISIDSAGMLFTSSMGKETEEEIQSLFYDGDHIPRKGSVTAIQCGAITENQVDDGERSLNRQKVRNARLFCGDKNHFRHRICS